MSKTSVPPEQEMRQLNVKVQPEDSDFVQETLRQQLGLPYSTEAVREVIAQLRTWFHLPAHVAELLKEDAATRQLNILEYLQMVLHRRYEEVTARDQDDGRKPVRGCATPAVTSLPPKH